MKKLYIIASVFALIAFLTGIPYIVDGIILRGFGGVNYGRVIFPALICALSFWLYWKEKTY